jgi:hypothetical protein
LKAVYLLRVLLTWAALPVSSMVHAQAHPPAPDPPDLRWFVLPQDRFGAEELRGANPCRRIRMPDLVYTTNEYQRMVPLPLCVQRARSQAVSMAWTKGVDTRGEKLAPDAQARKLSEMQLWLRSLAGKYRIDGKYWNRGGNSPIKGTADCFGIGSGPGVSCVISTQWTAPKESGGCRGGDGSRSGGSLCPIKDPRLDQALYVAMRGMVLLFGIDPGTSKVRVTLADFRAVGMSGFLDDGVVIFEGRSNFEHALLNPTITYTWATSLVATKPDGGVDMKFLVRASDMFSTPHPFLFDLQLHREDSASGT